MQVLMIVGMPGSGKTHLARKVGGVGFLVIDDIKSLDPLRLALEAMRNVAVTDVNFCDERVRDKALRWLNENFPRATVDWWFFENDAAKCRANVARRKAEGDAREVGGTIRRFEKTYKVPEGFTANPIWQPPKE